MAEWVQRRFWQAAEVVPADRDYAIVLDGRAVKTPAKAPLVLPTRTLAERIAREWQSQGDAIDPATMPFTRSANAAIDKVGPQFEAVAEMIAAYGETDLLCYRAEAPEALAERQRAAWDPLLSWAESRFGAPLRVTCGVVPAAQPPASIEALAARTRAMTAFELTAFHDLVTLSGSLVIALAVVEGQDAPDALWQRSRIDEEWQRQQWGPDAEAEANAEARREAFFHAAEFHSVCRI